MCFISVLKVFFKYFPSHCSSVCVSFFFQSKEIAFQLQEDLMKVLNELYTVSSNDCPFFPL